MLYQERSIFFIFIFILFNFYSLDAFLIENDFLSYEIEEAKIYIDSATNYLANDFFERAVKDAEQAVYILNNIYSAEKNYELNSLLLIGSFIRALSNGALGLEKETMEALQELEKIMELLPCKKCKKKKKGNGAIEAKNSKPRFKRPFKGVEGPDMEPYDGWCNDCVDGAYVALTTWVSTTVKNYPLKTALLLSIAKARDRAKECCQNGRFWKVMCLSSMFKTS
ncbi:MAG: hypothetical protein Tsb0015_02820 [Simkaniaceae bacterium]